MNQSGLLSIFLSTLTTQVPMAIVCVVACVLILQNWSQLGRAAMWAMLGFGLGLVICVLIPLVQTGVQSWVMQGGNDTVKRASIFMGLSIFWSVMRAVAYALLLMAVLAGRSKSQPTPP